MSTTITKNDVETWLRHEYDASLAKRSMDFYTFVGIRAVAYLTHMLNGGEDADYVRRCYAAGLLED